MTVANGLVGHGDSSSGTAAFATRIQCALVLKGMLLIDSMGPAMTAERGACWCPSETSTAASNRVKSPRKVVNPGSNITLKIAIVSVSA